jgi:hypothetical protein
MHKGFESAAIGNGEVRPSLCFHEIRQDAPEHIVCQLVGHDRVHAKGVQTTEELRRYRLGGEGFNKTCYALLDGETVISAIYVHKGYESIESDRDLNGNVAEILQEESTVDDRAPQSKIFYSISNIKNISRAGQNLVIGMYAHLSLQHPKAVRSTLSPLRTFDDKFSAHDDLNFSLMSMGEKKRVVLDYLLTGENPVQQFHMGNGARIADIKLDSGDVSFDVKTGQMRRHFAMVNYAYDVDAEALKANAAAFSLAKSIIGSKNIDPEERAVRVRESILPAVSSAIMQDAGMLGHHHMASVGKRLTGRHLDI